MKKKGLLILLVVFLVAILTFSVFACGGNKDKGNSGNKKPTTDTDDKDDGKKPAGLSGSAALNAMLSDIVKSVDDTLKVATAIDGQASITATIYADVEVDGKAYNVELNILGSMDKTAADKTWALVQADVLGVKVNLFAVDSANGETLYIGQNILNEGVKWSKLSQFKDANLLTDFVCNELFGLLTKLKTDSGAAIEKGMVGNLQILNQPLTSLLGLVSGVASSLIVPGANAGADYKTETGYSASLQLAFLGDILGVLPTLGVSIPANVAGIIEPIAGILLGGTVDLDGTEVFKANEGETVEIGLSVDKTAAGTFGGLGLTYKSTKTSEAGESVIKVAFGLKDVEFKAASLATSDNAIAKAAYEGVKGAGELAIAIDLGLDLPKGIYDGKVDVVVKAYPEIKVGFVDGAVKADFTNMYAVAEATFTPAVGEATTHTIAEYNVDPNYPEDIIIDLGCIEEEIYVDLPQTQFRVPVDLQAKTGNWTAPANAEGDASANIIDVLYTEIAALIGGEGGFDIGAIMGLVGKLGAIGEAITPYLDNIVIDTETAGQASVTVNFETLMAELLAPNGLISTIQSDWNNFSLIKYVDEVPTLVENLKLADLLAPADVLENIVALANTAIYEANKAEGQSYADYFASEGAVAELEMDLLSMAFGQLGLTIDTANLYDNLTLTLGGYAGNGIGFSIGATVGTDAQDIGLGLGLRIIDDAAKPETPAIEYAGDVNGYAAVNGMMGTTINWDLAYSSNTGNDGAALLLNTLAYFGTRCISLLENYITVYQFAGPGSTGSLAIEVELNQQYTTDAMGNYTYYTYTAAEDGALLFDGMMLIVADATAGDLSAWGPVNAVEYINLTAGQKVIFAAKGGRGPATFSVSFGDTVVLGTETNPIEIAIYEYVEDYETWNGTYGGFEEGKYYALVGGAQASNVVLTPANITITIDGEAVAIGQEIEIPSSDMGSVVFCVEDIDELAAPRNFLSYQIVSEIAE